MELKKDGVLFINLIFRVVAVIIFVSDYESPVLEVDNAVLNWNKPVTNRVVLILANGLRDDFLREGRTPFLRKVADENGTFARVIVDGIVTVDGSLRNLLSGVPWQGSLFPWNRPGKYKTILDYASCESIVGRVPGRHHPPLNRSEVFEQFGRMTPTDCLHVLSFDFGGTTARDYLRMLRELDEDVREASETWTETTWLLTSSRGWSVWNRTDGRVDVPLLAWGKGILPTRHAPTIRLMDVPALVSTLLGRSFPDGCLAVVPVHLISASPDDKFQMYLYNFEHLEKSLGGAEEDEIEFRNLNGIVDEENTFSLKLSMENFREMVRGLRKTRMRIFSIFAAVCFGFWGVVFLVVVTRGTLTVDGGSAAVVISVTAIVGVVTYLYPDILHVSVMVLLTPISILTVSDVAKAFHAEGYRMFLLSLVLFVLCTMFVFFGYHAAIVLLMIPVALWPFSIRVAHRMNRKVLLSWFISAVVLCVLPFFHVIGRDPTPGVTILSSIFHVGLFHFAHHSFKRRVDRQSWIITAVVLSCTYHVYFWHSWGITSITCLLSWCFLLYAGFAMFVLRGTLLERLLKFHLVLLIPMQILSTRHESLFHVSLALHMFSWVFTEHVPVEQTFLYNPSIFTLDGLPNFPSDDLQPKHYRQVFFFMTYAYLSYFAAGNLPTIYTYDYAIVQPFCDLCPLALIPLKIILPFVSVTYAFLTLHLTERTDPAPSIILSVHYSDIISSCFLLYAYILTDIFSLNASHYIILQAATASITALYLLQKYGCFHCKT